ncbi:hypothetical protein D9758_017788 [Tetrapyrgos nigripes]|uniref:Uncharacterized protein n=1 Tax=Tetrapyrgos nigripes TaxID=182062 RepID=A0A8H5BS01_9AGAR|nr:hypothetical protein D9758_017788 [Tetrapyrgos nigripes]
MSSSPFAHASHFVIQGSSINSVAGNQTIHVTNQFFNGGGLDATFAAESAFSEYRHFRIGDLFLLREVSQESVDDKHQFYTYGLRPREGFLHYTRTTSAAKVIGTEGVPPSTLVMYGGTDAYGAWKRDFDHYSQSHHPNVAHLFGLNPSRSHPALLFFDDLIPIMKLWSEASPVLRCLIEDRASTDLTHVMLKCGRSFVRETTLITGSLFVQPATGMICAAPYRSSSQVLSHTLKTYYASVTSECPPIPLTLYKDQEFQVLKFLDGALPTNYDFTFL